MELPKLLATIKSKITEAVHINPSLTASDIAQGKRLPFIPSAVDRASSHIGKITQIVKHGKESSVLIQKHWSPTEFEDWLTQLTRMIMQSVVIITISCKNTENWEDRICCQLVLMGKLDLFYHVSSAND